MNIALLTAGGTGNRMGQDIPKQFMCIDNQPVIVYTMQAFQNHPEIDAIALICLKGWETALQAYANQYNITKLKWIFVSPLTQTQIKPLYCPSASGHFAAVGRASSDNKATVTSKVLLWTYGINDHVVATAVNGVYEYKKYSKMKNPSKKIFSIDGARAESGSGGNILYFKDTAYPRFQINCYPLRVDVNSTVRFRHNKNANAVFVDGHCAGNFNYSKLVSQQGEEYL